MQLSTLDISKLEKVQYKSKQVQRILEAENIAPRLIYRSETAFFKIWPKHNVDCKTVIWRGKKRLIDNRDETGREVLPGFLYGFFNKDVCGAFVDYIYDDDKLVGYVTASGRPVEKFDLEIPSHARFLQRIIDLSLASGFAYRDLKARNLVQLESGELSLIDLEPPLVLLNGYQPKPEIKAGSLAHFTLEEYRKFIIAYLDKTVQDEHLVRHRERIEHSLPPKVKFVESENKSE
jgi:hypothetical protein